MGKFKIGDFGELRCFALWVDLINRAGFISTKDAVPSASVPIMLQCKAYFGNVTSIRPMRSKVELIKHRGDPPSGPTEASNLGSAFGV